MSLTLSPLAPEYHPEHRNGRKANVVACDHFVQFYECGQTLERSVCQFVSDGLISGESCIVIATAAHREGIERRLVANGIDVQRAEQLGTYCALDAAETLSMFMAGGSPDPQAFRIVIGEVIRKAGAEGRPVRAFGEMVAILWSEGNGAAAIRLEELWNELARTYTFRLMCGYPMAGFGLHSHDSDFADICDCHSRVIPAESFSAITVPDDQSREIAILQQKAIALEAEIAHRKEVEKVLARRERDLADFLESAVECLHTVGPDGTILWANQAELELLGYVYDQYIGHHIGEFHADRDVVDDMLARLLKGETLTNYPARLRCKDGSIKQVHVNSNAYFEDGRFVHTRCFTHDVTHLYESALTEHRLSAIVDSSDDAIISKTLDGIITSWNSGAERIFGYSAEEVIGKPKTIVFPPDKYDEEDEILSRLRCGERIEHFESIRIRKDGGQIDVSLTISPIRDAAGTIVGASTIARDITMAKLQQRELAELNERLKRSMTETHHRVKNNLQVVSAMIEMQMLDYSGREQIPIESFHRLKTHVRTLAVIHEMLTKSIRETEDAQRVSAKSVLDDLVPMLQQTAGDIAVTFDLSEVECTSKQCVALALIMNELVSNAIKHGRSKSSVCLSANGSNAILRVCDDGPGFPPDFDPVERANTGLELIQGLAHADLAGTITYENQANGGGCVSVSFAIPDIE